MGKRQLDRSRMFGLVYGGGAAVFEQHGILFDSLGEELPGFESVEIPAEAPQAVEEGNAGQERQVRELMDANVRLREELERARADLEAAEMLSEELQGKLDTALVEIERMNASPPGAEPAVAKKGKGAGKASDDLDAQLSMQAEV